MYWLFGSRYYGYGRRYNYYYYDDPVYYWGFNRHKRREASVMKKRTDEKTFSDNPNKDAFTVTEDKMPTPMYQSSKDKSGYYDKNPYQNDSKEEKKDEFDFDENEWDI